MRTDLVPRWVWALIAILVIVPALFFVFRLGSQASAGVALNDPVVWVEDGLRGRVLQINGSTQEVTATIDVGESGDSLSVLPRSRDAVYLNRTSGQVGVIGAISLAVDNDDDLDFGSSDPQGEIELFADFDASTDAFAISQDRILVVEPGAGQRAEIITEQGLGEIVVDSDGRLLAVTPDGARIGVSDERGLVPFVDLDPPVDADAEPPGLARAGDSTFLVDPSRLQVREVTADGALGPAVCVASSLSSVRSGGNVLSSENGVERVLLHDTEAGILNVSLPAESACFQVQIDEQGDRDSWGDPVALDRIAYLPNFESGQIHVVDMANRAVLDSIRFGTGQPFELEIFDGVVWANQPQGNFAAVVRGDNLTRISKISRVTPSDVGEEGGEGFFGVVTEEESNERIFSDRGDFGRGAGGTQVGGGGEEGSVQESEDARENLDPISGVGDEFFDEDLANAPVILEPGVPLVEDAPPPDTIPDLIDEPLPDEEIEDPENPDGVEELVANFEFSAETVNVGEPVDLTDTSSGEPVTWNWDFGDGTGAAGPEVTKIWDVEGVFTVTLFVTNAVGEEAAQSFNFTVIAPDLARVPTADFNFRSATVETGEALQFVDASTGDPDSLVWNFGDGTTATGSQVTHTFAAPGQFEVSLTAANEAGVNVTSAIITVVEAVRPPEAIIGTFPGVVEVGQVVSLDSESTNSPTALSWGFDDGNSALGTSVRHSWDEPGTYRIRLSVSNSAGADETFADIVVEPRVDPPVADFRTSAPGLDVIAGTTVNFADLSTNNPTSFIWEFGDGSSGQGPNVSQVYDVPGVFTVTLTVSNEAGSDSASRTLTVQPPPVDPPVADFDLPSAIVPVNRVVVFTDSSTGDATDWLWDFGDGATSTVQNPTHPFSTPGQFEVTLTASNDGGSDTITKTIIVADPPVASFTSSADELVASFIDTSTNDPTSWSWEFGDGTSSTSQSPNHAYEVPGTYQVTLTATNAGGTSTPFTQAITVLRQPEAAFISSTGNLTAQFTDQSVNNPTSWLWQFGDGTTSSVQNPSHTYTLAGTYNVTLTATNSAGADTTNQTVTVINAPPVAAISCQTVGATVACDATGSTGAATYSWNAPNATSINGGTTSNATFTYAASAIDIITVTVANADGVTDSANEAISVNVPTPPTINPILITSNNNGVVTVNATASNSPDSWSWTTSRPAVSVVGGATGSPTFTFDSSGPVTLTAIASNGVGPSAPVSVSPTITVSTPPVITAWNILSNSGGAVQIEGLTQLNNATSWSWTTTTPGVSPASSSAAAPTFTVTANGRYNGTVTATNNDGTSAPFSFFFDVNDLPAPVITGVNETGNSGGVVSLVGVASGNPSSWSWTAATPGVSPGSSSAAAPTFTVTANGTYTVNVTATNGNGTSAVFPYTFTVNDIVVLPPPPVINNVNTVDTAPGRVRVSANATNSPTGWSWNIPGSNQVNSTAASPAFTFAANGSYDGTVTASNAGGVSNTFGFTVVVTSVAPPPPPPPVASFTWAPGPGLNEISFTDTSTGTAATDVYTYAFGGGTPSGGSNDSPRATYPAPGDYTVTLTVTGAGGASNTFSALVTVP